MKKIVVLAVLIGVIAAVGFGASAAFAQGPVQGQPQVPGYGPGRGMMGGGYGYNTELQTKMREATAKALGLSLNDLDAQLRAGKTVSQIATEKKIDVTKLHDSLQSAHQAIVKQSVKDGKLTKEQGDWMIQRMDTMDKYFDANGGCPMTTGNAPANYQGGFARGGMAGGRGPWAQPTTK